MTLKEFAEKWKDHLETGHYGLIIDNDAVIKYLDEKFTELKETVPNFTYSQIKLKFGTSRVYMEPWTEINTSTIESEIDKLLLLGNPFKKGDKVHYIPWEGCPEDMYENGIVKSLASGWETFVVYHCGEEWDKYEEYTAAKTKNNQLKLGWV